MNAQKKPYLSEIEKRAEELNRPLFENQISIPVQDQPTAEQTKQSKAKPASDAKIPFGGKKKQVKAYRPKKEGSTQRKAAYTLLDLEAILNISKRTLMAYLKTGRLNGVKIGSRWIVSDENFQRFLNDGMKAVRKSTALEQMQA